MKRFSYVIALLMAFSIVGASSAQFELGSPDAAPGRWTDETLRLFGSLPVQDGGRVKPMQTLANFELLKYSGRRTCEDLDGRRINASEWLLDVLFHPDLARQYRVFLVEDAAALDALSLPYDKRRDRYSYEQIAPARQALMTMGQQYAHLEANQRTPLETQIMNLASNVHAFEQLSNVMQFARQRVSIENSGRLAALFDGEAQVGFPVLLARSNALIQAGTSLRDDASLNAESRALETQVFTEVLSQLERFAMSSTALALIPPPGTRADREEWLAPGDVVAVAFDGRQPVDAQTTALASLSVLDDMRDEPAGFEEALGTLHEQVTSVARARGEYNKIPLEIALYKGRFFSTSQMLYLICFLLAATTWARPKSEWLWKVAFAATFLPTLYLIAGITLRCVIRARPPVTTLYESILFITAVAVLVALFIEYVNRQRIALAMAAGLGALGMFLANKYEVVEGVDTMPSLIAVLDTNFWLSTHVTTVTIGYAAGFLASGVAHVYLLGMLAGYRIQDKPFYRSLSRMTYGIICFGLLFSVVGTVLGGIWANYSWGRFWGWDPKENGALMIVLWELAILHARMGGVIKNFGVCMAAVFGGVIVAFSWFGTNLLGVGLHSYGFTSGIAQALITFYIVESAVLALGAVAWWLRMRGPGQAAAAS